MKGISGFRALFLVFVLIMFSMFSLADGRTENFVLSGPISEYTEKDTIFSGFHFEDAVIRYSDPAGYISSFIMPASDVTINAVFEKGPTLTISADPEFIISEYGETGQTTISGVLYDEYDAPIPNAVINVSIDTGPDPVPTYVSANVYPDFITNPPGGIGEANISGVVYDQYNEPMSGVIVFFSSCSNSWLSNYFNITNFDGVFNNTVYTHISSGSLHVIVHISWPGFLDTSIYIPVYPGPKYVDQPLFSIMSGTKADSGPDAVLTPISRSDWLSSYEVTTDADGAYSVTAYTDRQYGTLKVNASHAQSGLTASVSVPIYDGPPEPATMVLMADPGYIINVPGQIGKTEITGTVYDQHNSPLPNVGVIFSAENGWLNSHHAITGPDGCFSINAYTSVASGILAVIAECYSISSYVIVPIYSGTTHAVTFNVYDHDTGVPLEGVEVHVVESNDGKDCRTVSNAGFEGGGEIFQISSFNLPSKLMSKEGSSFASLLIFYADPGYILNFPGRTGHTTIYGTLYDQYNRPMPDEDIALSVDHGWLSSYDAVTDADGRFTVTAYTVETDGLISIVGSHGDEINAIVYVPVYYDTSIGHTDEAGETVFGLMPGHYSYTVTADGYLGESDDFHIVDEDIYINVQLIPVDVPELYTVTLFVEPDGFYVIFTGAGEYEKGQTVNISVGLSKGHVFIEWAGDYAGILDDPASPATFFIMPEHCVALTAVFEQTYHDRSPAIISLENPSVKGIWRWEYSPSKSSLLDNETSKISDDKSPWTWNRLVFDHSASKILVADVSGNGTLEILMNLDGIGLCLYNMDTFSWMVVLPDCIDFSIARTSLTGPKQVIASDEGGTFVFNYGTSNFSRIFTVPAEMILSTDIHRNGLDELIMCFRGLPNLYLYSFVSQSASIVTRARPAQAIAGDLTGDGYPELVCAFEGHGIYIFRFLGTKLVTDSDIAEFEDLMCDVPKNNEWFSGSRGWQVQRITYADPMAGHYMALGNIAFGEAYELLFAFANRTYYYSYGNGFYTLVFAPMKTIIAGRFTGQFRDDLIACISIGDHIYLRHTITGTWQLLVNSGNTNAMVPYSIGDTQPGVLARDDEASLKLPRTGQTIEYRYGDDGTYQMGIPWPSPRFTDHGNGTVTDNLTGLMWTKDANMAGTKNWDDAIDWCNDLVHGGHSDWRLPNVRELYSLMDKSKYDPALPVGHPFTNIMSDRYWSSTTYAGNTGSAWRLRVGSSGNIWDHGKSYSLYVWAVRGTSNGEIQVHRTGQTIEYRYGDDGTYQMGAQWPEPRFTDHGDGTVTDNLTGLMWTRNANMGGTKNWNNAIDYCNTLYHGGHGDWRLPNIRELQSFMDYSKSWPVMPDGHPFDGIVSSQYWSSTTSAINTDSAWFVNMTGTVCHGLYKTATRYVWPVRAGHYR